MAPSYLTDFLDVIAPTEHSDPLMALTFVMCSSLVSVCFNFEKVSSLKGFPFFVPVTMTRHWSIEIFKRYFIQKCIMHICLSLLCFCFDKTEYCVKA